MSTPEKAAPAQPKGLGPRSKALWSSVTTEYILRSDEYILLEDLCRTMDLIDDLRGELRGVGMTYEDLKTGGIRTHPALSELRMQRQTAAALAKQLRLPEPDDERAARGAEDRETKARKAANARWAVPHGAPS